jgi:hypothetical protein
MQLARFFYRHQQALESAVRASRETLCERVSVSNPADRVDLSHAPLFVDLKNKLRLSPFTRGAAGVIHSSAPHPNISDTLVGCDGRSPQGIRARFKFHKEIEQTNLSSFVSKNWGAFSFQLQNCYAHVVLNPSSR